MEIGVSELELGYGDEGRKTEIDSRSILIIDIEFVDGDDARICWEQRYLPINSVA